MKNWIKTTAQQPIVVNMFFLNLLQVANYLIPLLLIPYVVRALGVDAFGKVTYVQNIIAYFTILVNYGFEYSATQEISFAKESKARLNIIFWNVIISKIFLLLVAFILLIVLYFTFDKVKSDPLLYFSSFLINIGFVLFPSWFFQGMEKMAKMSILNFLIRLIGALFVVLLVKQYNHSYLYLLILSLSYVFIGVISLIHVVRKNDLLPIVSSRRLRGILLKRGFPIFLNNIFATLYTISGITIVGFYVSETEFGIYAGAYKIIMAIVMLTSTPISVALFPRMSREFKDSYDKGWIFFRKSLFLAFLFSLFLTIAIYILAPFAVSILLGAAFQSSIPLLRAYAPLPMLIILASMFTVQGLYGMRLQKYAPFVGVFVGIISVVLNLLIIPHFGTIAVVWIYLIAELIEIILSASIVLYFLYLRKITKK